MGLGSKIFLEASFTVNFCAFFERFCRTTFFKNGLPSYLYIDEHGLLPGREGHFTQVESCPLFTACACFPCSDRCSIQIFCGCFCGCSFDRARGLQSRGGQEALNMCRCAQALVLLWVIQIMSVLRDNSGVLKASELLLSFFSG